MRAAGQSIEAQAYWEKAVNAMTSYVTAVDAAGDSTTLFSSAIDVVTFA